jgi:prepilin signal peptidase PulO-like enzyme (type II secretory pathway)
MALDLNYWLQPALVDPRTYGLFFLLGSFTVASLSDIRRMSAQSEFLHIWVLALLGLFVLDVYLISSIQADRFAFKWAAVAVLSLMSFRGVGVLFKLEWGDVAAIAAVCGLLSALMVPIFFIILIGCNVVLVPALRKFGKGNAYPFMPVVTAATLVAIPAASYLQTLNLVLG